MVFLVDVVKEKETLYFRKNFDGCPMLEETSG
jgi:hypothetical protein